MKMTLKVLTRFVSYVIINLQGGDYVDRQKMADKLIELRGEKSREQIAVDWGISYSAVVSYEIAERVPRDEMKVKIANYYNLNVEDIFFL